MLDFLASWAEEKKKEEKVAKRALRDGGGQKPEEQGTSLRLIFFGTCRCRNKVGPSWLTYLRT
jgi:hypothetical protein